jgi:hypothetical protein
VYPGRNHYPIPYSETITLFQNDYILILYSETITIFQNDYILILYSETITLCKKGLLRYLNSETITALADCNAVPYSRDIPYSIYGNLVILLCFVKTFVIYVHITIIHINCRYEEIYPEYSAYVLYDIL